MFNFLYRIFLTFNATFLFLIIYLIKSQTLISIIPKILLDEFPQNLFIYPCILNIISNFILLIIPFLLTGVSLRLISLLEEDNLSEIKDIEPANNAFLPSYLGYFFVALSVPNFETLICIYVILFIFTYYSQTLYFNPIFLIFGYHFYYITSNNNVKIFVISKKEIRTSKQLQFRSLNRITNFTFIDRGKKDGLFDGKN